MKNNERTGGAGEKIIFLESQPTMETSLPPWLFRHNDLIRSMASATSIDKKKLTNILNLRHFKGDPVCALLNHPPYEEEILVKARPEPCLGEELTCQWDKSLLGYNLECYRFRYLIVPHDQSVILVPARVLVQNSNGLTIQLPEQSLVISGRQTPRFACQNVKAEMWQNGFQADGELIDFGPHAFRIRVQSAPSSSFHWFNAGVPAIIRLSDGKNALYSGNCHCLYQERNSLGREIVLSPVDDRIQRFEANALRNARKQSSPPFHAIFEHPFIKKRIQREIFDISTSGFSILDQPGETVLMPGMIIPDMTITYAGMVNIHCKVQVIYRKEEASVRFGMTILDMDLENYNNLNQLLNNLPGFDQGMTNDVDLDQLWELFFDAGFIYPAKYDHIQAFRKSFQETYRKLYNDVPEIAKHFTYQKNGRIYSHISIIRAYERAWMGQHHAARTTEGRHTGLVVLKQLLRYLNDMRRLPSANLDYYMCCYRPDNKFTNRLYSRFFEENADPGTCSRDLFAYLSFERGKTISQLPEGWSLGECSASDLWKLEQFYKHHSGGLLLKVLSLDRRAKGETLEKVYAAIGLIRRKRALALYDSGDLKAVIVAEESDVAINLSDLLNGFKILVMDPDIPPEIIFAALGILAKSYKVESLPVLIYPADYGQGAGLQPEKEYFVWILDAQIGNAYIEYLGRRFRMSFI
ncbi:MAG: hypothetical protein PHN75_07590 [Syntrophales bacterium]|nr:hypothetical protein [Syntrophales bacterium]